VSLNPFRTDFGTHPAVCICRTQWRIYKWANAEGVDLTKN